MDTNGQPLVNKRANLTGQDNYVWLDAKGSGQYAGVTMSILRTRMIGGVKATICFSWMVQ